MTAPRFFATPAEWRAWLAENHAAETELSVGFWKKDSGRASITWPQSVDEALCFGWIDGVRRRIDDAAYSIRFTPRKPGSIWSAINIAKVEQLQAAGRMTAAGAEAFARRTDARSKVYSHEQAQTAQLSAAELREFKRNELAWSFFEATPPGYKKVLLHWITGAKKPETRAARLAKLTEACAAGQRLR